jgi:hypothetical protein
VKLVEALQLKSLNEAVVVAGNLGLENTIRWVHVVDLFMVLQGMSGRHSANNRRKCEFYHLCDNMQNRFQGRPRSRIGAVLFIVNRKILNSPTTNKLKKETKEYNLTGNT